MRNAKFWNNPNDSITQYSTSLWKTLWRVVVFDIKSFTSIHEHCQLMVAYGLEVRPQTNVIAKLVCKFTDSRRCYPSGNIYHT